MNYSFKENVFWSKMVISALILLQYLATRAYNKTFLMEEVLQLYLSDELTERRKVHEEEIKELSKQVAFCNNVNNNCPLVVLFV